MGLYSLEHGRTAWHADSVFYALVIAALALLLVWRGPPGHAAALASWAAAGTASWTLVEYGLHRLVLHRLPPFRGWHEAHHRRPAALIGLPTMASAPLFAVLVVAPAIGLAGAWAGTAYTLGMLVGYLGYASVHHAIHHAAGPGRWLRERRRMHARHHHPGSTGVGYGVTSGFWDRVFGTLPTPPAKVDHGRR